jgi:hypothetical protein
MGELAFETGDGVLVLLDPVKGSFQPCHPPRQHSTFALQLGPHFLDAQLAMRAG